MPEIVAHHYTAAGLNDEAIPHWQRAGQRASERSAHVEAIRQFTKALELLETLPATDRRILQELDLQTRLGSALMTIKGYAAPETQQAYARARALCQQLGEVPQVFPVLRGLWIHHTVRAEFKIAQELGEECLRLAQSSRDPTLLPEAHFALGGTQLWLGELTSALANVQQGFAFYDSQQHRSLVSLYGQDPGMGCLCYGAWALWLLGYPDQALQRIHQALQIAKEVSHPYSLVVALSFAARLHQLRRESRAVQDQAAAAVALASEQGYAYWVAQGMILHGWAVATQEVAEEGIGHMRQGLADLLTTGAELLRPYFLALFVEVYRQTGRAPEGMQSLADALALVDKNGERWWHAELYRLKGELLLPAGEREKSARQAVRSYQEALNISRRQQAKSLELRTATSLARLWADQGKRQQGHQLLAAVHGWFTEGFETADLKAAKALLDQLG